MGHVIGAGLHTTEAVKCGAGRGTGDLPRRSSLVSVASGASRMKKTRRAIGAMTYEV